MRVKIVSVVAFSLVGLGACTNAPTLPLPPPEALASAPDRDGLVTVTGDGAIEGALISVYNPRTREGRITTADDAGRFSVRIEAIGGDSLQLWQRASTRTGEIREIVVPTAADAGAPTDGG